MEFIDGNVNKTANNNIWTQAEEYVESIWRFHDGSTLPDFLKRDMIEANSPDEFHLRYVIDKQQFWDREATSAHSYIYEHRIY